MNADEPPSPEPAGGAAAAPALALERLERTVAEMSYAVVEMTKAVHRANSLLVPIINETSALLQLHRATESVVERLARESAIRTEQLMRVLAVAETTLAEIDKRLAAAAG